MLDFAMPGMNGGDLARELKMRRPSAPILFATGYVDVEALTDVGEDLIVHKPFTQAELARKLSRGLAGCGSAASAMIRSISGAERWQRSRKWVLSRRRPTSQGG